MRFTTPKNSPPVASYVQKQNYKRTHAHSLNFPAPDYIFLTDEVYVLHEAIYLTRAAHDRSITRSVYNVDEFSEVLDLTALSFKCKDRYKCDIVVPVFSALLCISYAFFCLRCSC